MFIEIYIFSIEDIILEINKGNLIIVPQTDKN